MDMILGTYYLQLAFPKYHRALYTISSFPGSTHTDWYYPLAPTERRSVPVSLDSGKFHHPFLRLIPLFQFNSIFLHTLLFFRCPPTHTLLAKLSPRLPPPVICHPLPFLLHPSDTNNNSLG